jgi:outer membrane receptor protein involved in Fe transport
MVSVSAEANRLPQSGVEQVTTIVGGTPAQYGDATGGIISITTRGPSKRIFSGGLEVVTSEVLDPYGYNLSFR